VAQSHAKPHSDKITDKYRASQARQAKHSKPSTASQAEQAKHSKPSRASQAQQAKHSTSI